MQIEVSSGSSYFALDFGVKVRTLSSAVLNGGFCRVGSVLNLRVDENLGGVKNDFPPPEQTLLAESEKMGLLPPTAGMMTAASMNSFKRAEIINNGAEVYCYLTSGLSNALAAGDPGEFDPGRMFDSPENVRFGTINIAAGTNLALSDAAMAEALMVCTEAKSSVLFELGVKSTVSGRTATGTGTDSMLIFSAGGAEENYCGKHTILGEMFAAAVRTALNESLRGDRLFTGPEYPGI
jgi:adenosylcobinamide amidohydrolase